MTCYKKQLKIAIFGGSFDPIHNGHIKVYDFLIKKLKFDKVYLVPAKKSPFKTTLSIANSNHRISMLKNVGIKNEEISMFEIESPSKSYSINTIKYFKNKFPKEKLFTVIGADHISTLDKWKDIDEIAKLSQIIMFCRKGYKVNEKNQKQYNVKVISSPIFDGSSTGFKSGKLDTVNIINKKYIAKNFLYLEDILKNTLSLERYIHSKNTAILAKEYAVNLNENEQHAYIAGLVHDITKEWSVKKHRKYLDQFNFKHLDHPDKVLHQFTGAFWLEHEYLINHKDILTSVGRHTTANLEMSTMNKIVLIADKLEKNRFFPEIDKIRALAFSNFEKCFKILMKKSEEHLIKNHQIISKESKLIFKKWNNKEKSW